MTATTTTWTKLLDLLFEDALVGRCLVAPDGTILRANSEWLRSTGFTGDVVGEDAVALFPEVRDMALALHARARAGHHVEVPRHAQTVNRRETWWEGSIDPIPMEGGIGLLITAREVPPASEAVRDPSERMWAEEALRESEERLREYADLLEHAPVLIRDPDDRITAWNEGMERLYGWDRADAIGQVSHELLRTRFPQPLAQIRATLELTGRWEGELRHRRRDGSVVIASSMWILHRDRDGRARAVVEVNSDITDRRRAEAALHDNEERLRLFVEHAPAAVAMFDRDMRYLIVSRRFLSDYRLSSRDVIGRSHYEVFPEIPERWRAVHRRCLAGAVERCDEDPFSRGDGTLDWVRWEIHPWYTSSGSIGGVILFSEVITERKRSIEVLRASEERFRLLVQGVKDYAIYMIAPDGTVQSWSAAAERIFGYREDEIVGRDRAAFFTHEQHAAGRPGRDLENALREGRFQEEDWRVRKDGTLFRADVLITAVRDDAGRLRGFANVTRDVTDRRKAEAALRESEGKYVAIHDRAPFGIALTKLPEATFVTANDAFLRLFGFSREEVVGKTSVELGIADPDAQAVVRRELERSGSLRDFEVTRRTRSGGRIDISLSVERVTIAGSEYVLTTTQDVTQRKRAEEALRASEERVRLAQEVARVGTFERDLRSGVDTWTPELDALYGVPHRYLRDEAARIL